MLTNDILMAVTQGTVNGQQCQNTFFYRVTVNGVGDTPQFSDWAEGFWDQVLKFYFDATTLGLFHTGFNIETVRIENLFVDSEIGGYSDPTPITGTQATGEATAQFVAYGFTQPSGRRGMNSGKRRFTGVPEIFQGAYGLIVSTAPGILDTLGARMSQVVNLSGFDGGWDIDLSPCIVKRVRSGQGTPAAPYEYRLPRNQGEAVSYRASNWTPDRYVTTQNSRKTGRGM